MSITTVAVTCSATRPDGSLIAGGKFRFLLSAADTENGLVVPREISAIANASGVAIANLWPNSLGAAGTQYRVLLSDPLGGTIDLGVCTVPNSACSLHSILGLGTAPTLDQATVAKLAAQQSAAESFASATQSADSAAAALVSKNAAAASETAASNSATAASTSATSASADRVQTGLDRTQTGSDKSATAADRIQTSLDRTQTTTDKTATASDRVQTGLDRTQTGLDKVATAADRVQTGLDRTASGASATATAADRVQTGLDRTQTGLDRTATAADRVQTGIDRTASDASASSAASSATAAAGSLATVAASASAAALSETNAANSAGSSSTQAGIATAQAAISTDQAAASATSATAAATSAVSALNAPGTSGTSTTSLTVGVGAQTFTTQTAKAWVVGQFVTIAAATPANSMNGYISAYNSGTGSMSVVVSTISGSGTFASWTIGLSAPIPANAVVQSDIGTAANQIPLNQYLGRLAYEDAVTTLNDTANAFVGVTDVGILPNQVPLNQYLGRMAYQSPSAVQITGGTVSAQLIHTAPTPTALTATATLTTAQIQTKIITVNSTTSVALTMPTGTQIDGAIVPIIDFDTAIDFWIINLGSSSGAVTVSGATGTTLVGSGLIAISTSAFFRLRRTALNTYSLYRLA